MIGITLCGESAGRFGGRFPTLAQATRAAQDPGRNATAVQFSDVPANHWAYPALQQLQADGLVEGYPGGYFKGDRH